MQRLADVRRRNNRQRTGFACVVVALALSTVPGLSRSAGAAPARVVFLTPVSSRASLGDDLFLAAVPAASAACGKPLVCAVDPASPWRPELLDYLRRYKPSRVVWLGPAPTAAPPAGIALQVIRADNATDGACRLAPAFWRGSARAVAYRTDDRSSALAASALAARLGAPLFPCPTGALPEGVQASLARLGVTRLLAVGAPIVKPAGKARFSVERLPDALSVARRLAREPGGIDYLAVTHPTDGGAPASPRLSLASVLLAAGRRGAVVPLPSATVWKRRFPAGEPVATPPPGARPSATGHRAGVVDLGARTSFVTGQDADDGRWWAQFDLNADGRFDGAGEGPIRTGGVVAIGATRLVVDVDVLENERGRSVWLTSPTPADITELLATYRKAIGSHPRYLCLVGWPDAVPLAITSDGHGVDTDVVTDHPYAQTDADPFVDVAFARFVAEDAAAGTLLACRSLTAREVRDTEQGASYATAEWSDRNGSPPELAGLRFAGHHDGASTIRADSPLTRVGAILHDSHSMWTVLGNTYAWDSQVLLAPCIVVSGGCSPASLDQDAERRSVAARLLRNGAVAFVGGARRCVAQSALYRSELWNALLDGQTLGEAHRTALNRSMVAILEKGEQERGSYRYQQDHFAAYGDPALDLGLRRAASAPTARVKVNRTQVEVVAPAALSRTEYAPLPEWKCRFPKLWAWNGLGLGTESSWCGDRYDVDDLLMTAEVRSKARFTGVEPLEKPASPLGWTGSCFVDEHADGTRSVYWRCRFVDFDMTTGQVRGQVGKLGFRLVR
jgi:hypothetical protein